MLKVACFYCLFFRNRKALFPLKASPPVFQILIQQRQKRHVIGESNLYFSALHLKID